jgi:protease-4
VRALIVDIDSYGGLPVAGEEIANALKKTPIPTVAVIRTAGLSSAYWAASGADHIVASRNSDVGSIGVSLQLRNFVEKNRKEGIRVTSITSGQYKGIGDPNRELTPEEKKLLQQDVDAIHSNFVDAIAENRGMERSLVATYANGASVLGSKALEQGLIDEIGDLDEAKAFLEKEIGREVRICIPPQNPAS